MEPRNCVDDGEAKTSASSRAAWIQSRKGKNDTPSLVTLNTRAVILDPQFDLLVMSQSHLDRRAAGSVLHRVFNQIPERYLSRARQIDPLAVARPKFSCVVSRIVGEMKRLTVVKLLSVWRRKNVISREVVRV